MNRRSRWCLLSGFALACGGARGSQPGAPSPAATSGISQPGVPAAPTTETSSFNYAPGIVSYRISRSAAIESMDPDSVAHREISTNITHELLTLERGDQVMNFTGLIDTSTTTTRGLIGSVQSAQLPVQISGSLTDSTLTITAESTGGKCNAVSSMLVTDLHNLLIRFPSQLSSGLRWTDSVDVTGCQAAVPTAAHTSRSYVVSGNTSYETQQVLVILRTDTTHAKGEGGLQQHRVSLDAIGTGTAVYYLNTTTGRIVRLTVDQHLDLSVTVSDRRSRFKQNSKQDFQIIP
jgi:hypothetical protein